MAFLLLILNISMKKYIPNTITCLNLFSGCIGVLWVLKGEYTLALYCVVASGIFDFFDGMVARLLHVKSLIGKELDSLADMVSFGFLPGAVMYTLLLQATENVYIPYLGFLITVFSALRLAKFNIDERQTSDFIGVNTPMNTFLIVSLPFMVASFPLILGNVYFLLGLTLGCSLLLVSELRLFSMKLSSVGWAENKFKYIFLLVSLVLILAFKIAAVPMVFLSYILFSVFHFRQQGRNV
ncbi:CDP-alcohol phosphatidyltransferase family protein [Sphingobacterium sp. C459-1T]|uniref:CDP-alcohol phosphatidyltransferase family protein n=2 Tax=Sphingobacterium faecale TaxID=2803775 RepID=A0ABS1R5N0_9SPHI|nr:CDP-alcohol phosphatidyltransferase family protein [Sphingobacterium faecale]